MFLAIVLCFMLCLPVKSLSTSWSSFKNSLASATYNVPAFPPILSIQFKFEDSSHPLLPSTALHLIPEEKNQYFHVDWASISAKNLTVKLYSATGKFIATLQEKNSYSTTNQLVIAPDSIKLSPGIYYAYAQCSAGINTQNGYAKFVVK